MNKYIEYVWDISFQIPNRNIAFKPYSIVQFIKTCNYFDNFIPSYTMICKIEDRYLDFFRFYDKELYARIKLYAFSGTEPDKKTDKKLILEDIFAIYIDKSEIPSFSKSDRTSSSQKIDNGIAGNTYTKETITSNTPVTIKMNLLLNSDLLMKTYIHNYVFGTEEEPVSPISAAVACINLNPYVKRFVVDKPDNTNRYTDLIVEPGELKQVLYNIQRKYGIYAKSMELFYDSGTLYMLNKINLEHSKIKGEVNLINVKIKEKTEQPDLDFSVYYNNTDGTVAYKRTTSIVKEDTESISALLKGDKFVYSNFSNVINSAFASDGETKFISPLEELDNPTQARADVGVKKIVDYDMLNNPFNMSSYMFEQNIGVPVGFTLNSVDISHFTPNKNIKLAFDTPESNKLYSGIYNIKQATFIFNTLNQPNALFRTYGHVTLVLCNKSSQYDNSYTVQKPR